MRIRVVLAGLACLAWTAARTVSAPGQGIPDSIAVEGVPALPASLIQELNRYQNIRTASFQDWEDAPGHAGQGGQARRAMWILTRFGNTNQVHRVAFPGGARTQLTFFAERVLGVTARPGVPSQFAFSMDEGGAENYQVYWQDARGGEATRLTDGRSRNESPRWSHSGRLLAFSSNARNGRDMDLYVADPGHPGPARRFKEVTGSWSVADWSPDDRRVAAIEYLSINESYVHLVDVATGATETLTPRRHSQAEATDTPSVSYGKVRWSGDGRSLCWTTDVDSDFLRLARYDLETRRSTPLTAGIPWDVAEFDIADDGSRIALVANEGGLSRLHVLDATNGRELPVPDLGLPAGQISSLAFRNGTHEVGFTFGAARAPSDAYSFDFDSGRLERWTESELAGLDPATFPEPELIHYPSFDGRSIPAFVYRPDARRFPGRRPVLISIHGGPERQYQPEFLDRANHLIHALGLVLVFPNIRGSSGYGKAYLKLDNAARREDAVKDIGALLDWIAAQPGLDATRVGVTGGSYGGFMSLAAQVMYNDRIRAGIDVVGISNFVTFLTNTQAYRRDLRRAEYGDERDPAMRTYLERISPLTNAAKIRTPLLVVAGKNDPRVPVTESEQMVAAVRQGGNPVWYVLGKDEGHGFAKKVNQDYRQAVDVLFLERYLLGQSDTR
jgi:dipeptidyl aminopeptidase/acylaminoacyl peptidase